LEMPSIKFRSTYAIFSLPISVSLILSVFIFCGKSIHQVTRVKFVSVCVCACDDLLSILFSLENTKHDQQMKDLKLNYILT